MIYLELTRLKDKLDICNENYFYIRTRFNKINSKTGDYNYNAELSAGVLSKLFEEGILVATYENNKCNDERKFYGNFDSVNGIFLYKRNIQATLGRINYRNELYSGLEFIAKGKTFVEEQMYLFCDELSGDLGIKNKFSIGKPRNMVLL